MKNEGSGETAWMCMLTLTYAICICYKIHFCLMQSISQHVPHSLNTAGMRQTRYLVSTVYAVQKKMAVALKAPYSSKIDIFYPRKV